MPPRSDAAEEEPGVLIIGAGLIGTSIGLALTAAGRRVHLIDRVPSHALIAASLGAGLVDPPRHISLVVVAVPPAVTATVVAQSLHDYPEATVTDVASVKSPVLRQVRATGVDDRRYIGSHPMAGSHRAGPLTARSDLFVDRTWVITAETGAEAIRVEDVRQLAVACGARIELMEPAEHDVAVAEVSHVPQILSSLMAGNLADVEASHLRLGGQGVRDVTRIAASDPGMWTQIITANRAAIQAELIKLSAALDEISSHLDSPMSVTQFMARGLAGARALPGKHGRTAADYAHVVVEIPDSPGALARLFADVEAAGVNVEDLGIEHDRSREMGYMNIAVEQAKADALAEAMAQAGWRLKPGVEQA